MDRGREVVWQDRWAARRLGRAERVPGRAKFFGIMAYPGSSGFLHIGHLRGLAYVDLLHRFQRMRGRQVFFPTGTHASGLPAVTFAQRVQNRDPAVVAQLTDNGIDPALWPSLEDPPAAARFLGEFYLRAFRRFGLLVDESAYVTTIDEDYQAFIRWQFEELHRRHLLVQAPHYASFCPVCGPVSVDPSETDLSTGGDAETVVYTTVPFPMDDGRILLAATLRPETVYGATNLWVPPSEPLVVWHQHEREYLVSREAASRLVEQHGGRVGHSVAPTDLVGRVVRAPLTDRALPILPSGLVDPLIGTGVVMSVPAHAPADWVAIGELSPADRARLPPIEEVAVLPGPETLSGSEVALLAGTGSPAERAARATGAHRLSDRAALDDATERLYRLEYSRGRMRPDLLEGVSVPEARDRVVALLRPLPGALEIREFSKPVVCRNGHPVVIRRVPDQWFIHYSDPAWKAATRDLLGRMEFAPKEYGEELPGILDWFQDRPCTRRGRWLGTPFPDDPSWVIEPIADSTFYPAYFVVRRFVADGRLTVPQLTGAFFDYVFLGRGAGEPTVPRSTLDEVRAEFTYWYPLDLNLGGKEHKRVHFPVFLATHAAFLPPELQPRSIFVNWWLTEKGGGKLSKKRGSGKGGVIPPLHEAFERWGADAIRLFYAQAASPHQDVEWDPSLVDAAARRLEEVERLVGELGGPGSGGPVELERWLESEVHELIRQTTDALESYSIRVAAEFVYAKMPQLVRRYVQRGGSSGPEAQKVRAAWVRLLQPMTPHLSEELGAAEGSGLIAESRWPDPEEFTSDPAAREAERYLDGVEEDLRTVVALATTRGEAPEAVDFYVASPWKTEIERWVGEALAGGRPLPPLKEFLDRAAAHPELASARPQIAAYISRIAPALRGSPSTGPTPRDEVSVLRSATGYLARRFGFSRVGIHREDEAEAHDPKNRRARARPGKPAFFLTASNGPRTPKLTGDGAGS